ncbi:SusC/RagA family TonB-linked outer membrane protein [Mangrovibacterium lignilyticum]|uniref:SusC/RagA family TonB-linked outer membrane protein n=1 Tax=Mangrovibacterium lignilyticum TaxID=2668052 RepID=UPI0013D33C1C|nr:SusC/RagA family TonB-linked outer membrane protein [Mangrovibacterium lignilyticum]
MNKKVFFILLFLIGAFSLVKAQDNRFTAQLKKVSLKQVFELIQQQSEFIVFYNDSQVDLNRKVTVLADDSTVDQVLQQALKNTGLSYKKFDRQIIILKDQSGDSSGKQNGVLSDEWKTIEGKVTDENGNSLLGVSVFVQGKSYGVTTDVYGDYSLKVPVQEDFLTFSFVGMKSSQVNIDGKARIDVVLIPDDFGVEEVVVSALGIRREEKSLTYATQTIDFNEINGREYSFVGTLSGKVAGMEINHSAAGAGGSSKVLLRGNKSLSAASEPLFVIDGIPMTNNKGNQLGLFDGADQGDGLSQVNTDDIESITVLKGANAAALYGSEGANGVILINTKRGKPGKLKIDLNSYFTVESIQNIPEMQYDYGSIGNAKESWSYTKGNYANNYIKDFFQHGTNWVNSLALSGGGEKTVSYFSVSNTASEGVIPGNKYEKLNLAFKQTSTIFNDKVKIGSNILLTNEKVSNKYVAGYYLNPLTGLYLFPREKNFAAYAENYQVFNDERNMYLQNWYVQDHFQSNPNWIVNNEKRTDEIKRLIGSLFIDYDLRDNLRLQMRGSYDFARKVYEEQHKAGSNITNVDKNGRWVYENVTDELIYGDAILFFNDQIGKWRFNAVLGTSYQKSTYGLGESVDTGTDGLIYPNEFYFQNIESNVMVNSVLASRLIKEAVFGNVQIGYDEKVFLDLSGRNDWASSLYGTGNDSYFYPSAGITALVSELAEMPSFIEFGKIRGSYAMVSNEVPFNRINPQNKITKVGIEFNTVKPLDDLKPESIRSFEIGTDWKLFDNRVGFDLTYYRVISRDQFIELPAPSGVDYTSYYINAGKLMNSGKELSLYVKPVRNSTFEWVSTWNYSDNKNKIVSLHPDLKDPIVLSDNEGYQLIIQKGGSFGDIYVHKFLRDDQGRILVNESGTIPKTENQEYVGHSSPGWSLGWNNHFTYKNFTCEVLLNGKFGGKVISQTEAMLDGYGVSKATGEARDLGYVKINGVLSDGTPVDQVDPQLYYTYVGGRDGIKEAYTYDRTNIRLAQFMLSYDFKFENKFINKMQFTLFGQNLFFLYRDAPFDPEITLNTLIEDQAIDSFSVPSTRSVGLRLKFQF